MRSLLLVPFALAACAKGGGDDRPTSEVQITASHHTFGFRSRAGFGALPTLPGEGLVTTDRGTLNLFTDSSYTFARPSGTTGNDTYALSRKGELTLYVSGSGRDPTVLFRGGYELAADAADLFFTDRVTNTSSPSIGLYVGTEVIAGAVELEGGWHVASLHVIFGQATQVPDSVARAVRGSIAVAAGAPGTARAITGSGQNPQTTVTTTFGGTVQNVLPASGTGDGTCNLTLSYQIGAQTADSRVFRAAAGNDILLGLDEDMTDGEAGLAFFVREFDAPTTPAVAASIAGRYLVGGYTAFVNASDPGADAFVGVVTLTEGGAFNLDAVGHQGFDFSYVGTATYNQDGSMSIAISGTNEIWFAAIDRDYRTLIFLDDWQETRPSGVIELNLGFGVREKVQ